MVVTQFIIKYFYQYNSEIKNVTITENKRIYYNQINTLSLFFF